MSLSTFYQFIKDLAEGAEDRRTARLSAEQIDLNITELDRRLNAEIQRLQRKGDEERARYRAKVGASGITLEGSPQDVLRSMELGESREINDLRDEARYLKKMLALEKAKLIALGPTRAANDGASDVLDKSIVIGEMERR